MFDLAADHICTNIRPRYSRQRRGGNSTIGGISGNGGKGPKLNLQSDNIRRARKDLEAWDRNAAKSRAFQAKLAMR